MQILLSQPLLPELQQSCKTMSASLIDQGVEPQLAVLLVGAHPDSVRYIAIKTKMAKELGVIVSLYHMESETTFEQVKETITYLNSDTDIHGIIVQLPLPENFTAEQTDSLLQLVDSRKDVDGLSGAWQSQKHSEVTITQLEKSGGLLPPMVCSILSLLDFYHIELSGKKIVLIGQGRLVGAPLLSYFKNLGLDVISVNEETPKILDITQTADIVISGTGEKDLVTYQWIKEGAVVIDCAEDIHEDSVIQVASALAPSKGGVGPLTVLWLLHNTIQRAVIYEGDLNAK